MTKKIFSFVFAAMLLFFSMHLVAQVGINDNSSAPDNSAILDVSSASKGFLPPRMTTAQRDAIQTPAEGLTIYNTDLQCIEFYTGAANGWYAPCLSLGTISCTNPVVNSTFTAGMPLSAANAVSVTVNNMTTGGFNISTNTVNGFQFSKMGSFTTIGSQVVVLIGSGIPDTAGTSSFTVTYGNSTCTFNVPVIANPLGQPCPGIPGSSITVTHIAGAIAPVSKTVTYGLVANIPGEPAKCWITSNLGADHQANAIDDATETSAGWYWQFNRKQGYKHDGSTLTPTWTIAGINEDSDWIPANDPCKSELGTGWRIPSSTEWTNVKAGGAWANWNGPWDAGLKIHAAGYLLNLNGALSDRSQTGVYWSGSQSGSVNGLYLVFGSSFLSINNADKTYGFSLRCIKDN